MIKFTIREHEGGYFVQHGDAAEYAASYRELNSAIDHCISAAGQSSFSIKVRR